MRVLVCGGRDYKDRRHVFDVLDDLDMEVVIDEIIEGGASGADRLARMWAQKRGVPFVTFEAPWDDLDSAGSIAARSKTGRVYNKNAGPIRNRWMLIYRVPEFTEYGIPDLCVAFPGGGGTRNMMIQALEHGVTVRQA